MSNQNKDIFQLGILTISDLGSIGKREDTSGEAISKIMSENGFEVRKRDIVPDEVDLISGKLIEWSDSGSIDILISTGGTGLGPRDVTPEATEKVIDFDVPGIGEVMRLETLKFTPFAMLSRSVAGVRSGCLIINLPGSEKAVKETLQAVLPALGHALQMLKGWRIH